MLFLVEACEEGDPPKLYAIYDRLEPALELARQVAAECVVEAPQYDWDAIVIKAVPMGMQPDHTITVVALWRVTYPETGKRFVTRES